MTTNRPNGFQPPAFTAATWLVAEREIRQRLRSRAFVISTVILMAAILASVVIGSLVGGNPSKTPVAAVGTAVQIAEKVTSFRVTESTDVAAAEKLVRSGAVDAALVPDSSPTGVRVIGLDSTPTDVVGALSVPPQVQLLEASGTNPLLAYIVSIGFGVVFFMSAITFGQTIAQSVVEEKSTRVVEILLATIPARALLAGKIIGNSLLAFAQIAAIAILTSIGLLATGQNVLLADVGPALVWFVVFFVVGFVMLAAFYSATAALVSRQEDLASAVSPVTMLVMLPYLLIVFFNSNPLVLGIMSYVPFSAPIGMPVRVFLGDAQWWEPVLSLLVLAAFTVLIIQLGARIYENGLLRMGARVKLREALTR